jgi:hypothetical protein
MAIQSFLDYLGTKNIFLQTNLAGDGQADLVYGSATNGDASIITQNDFSVNYTAWLKSAVFGSDDFYNYVDSLDLANETDILAKLDAGDFHVELNQNSSTGSPYITELQGLVDFDALFGDSTGTTLKTGRTTQDRFYVSEVDLPEANQAPTATHIEATATETESEYAGEFGVITNQDLPGDTDPKEINLLSTASDPDGDPLTVSAIQFFDENGDPIAKPDYITIDGNKLIVEQNHPDLNELLDGATLNISVEYTISDDHGHSIQNTADLEITGTADQYQSVGNEGSISDTHVNADSNQHVLDLNLDNDLPDNAIPDSFSFHSGTITADSANVAAPEGVTVSDDGADDWADDAFNLPTEDGTSENLDVPGALDDGQVDYIANITGPNEADDAVTVTVDYQYDYWYLA